MAETTTGPTTDIGTAVGYVKLDTKALVAGRVQVQLQLGLVQAAFAKAAAGNQQANDKVDASVKKTTAATMKALKDLERERNADAARLKKATTDAEREYDRQAKAAETSFKKQADSFKNTYSKAIQDESKKLAANMQKLGQSMGAALGNGLRAGANVLAGAGIGAVLFSGKKAIDFETAFNEVKRFVGGTEQELAKLQVDLRGLALDPKVGQSFEDLAKIASMGGQLGVANKDIIEFTRQVAYVGQAGDASGEQVATGLAKISSAMKLPASDFAHLSSALAQMGKEGASKMTEIIDTSQRLAAAARQVGLSAPSVLAFANSVVSLGQEPEAAGTALSRVFTRINVAVHSGSTALQTYARVAGMSAAQFKKAFAEDAGQAVLAFVTGLDKIPAKSGDVDRALSLLGVKEIRLRQSVLNLAAGHEQLAANLASSTKAYYGHNVAEEMAEKASQTTARQMKVLQNQIADVANEFGQTLLPKLNDFIHQAGTPTIDTLKDLITWFRNTKDEAGSLASFFDRIGKSVAALGEIIHLTIQQAARESEGIGKVTVAREDASALSAGADTFSKPMPFTGIDPAITGNMTRLVRKYGGTVQDGLAPTPAQMRDAQAQAQAAVAAGEAAIREGIRRGRYGTGTNDRSAQDRLYDNYSADGSQAATTSPPPNLGGLKTDKEIKGAEAAGRRAAREAERRAEEIKRINEDLFDKLKKLTLSKYDYERYIAEKERNAAVQDGGDKANAQTVYYATLKKIDEEQEKERDERGKRAAKSYKEYTDNLTDTIVEGAVAGLKARRDAEEAAEKLDENRFNIEVETGRLSVTDALRVVNRKLAAEKEYSEEWMRLYEKRKTLSDMEARDLAQLNGQADPNNRGVDKLLKDYLPGGKKSGTTGEELSRQLEPVRRVFDEAFGRLFDTRRVDSFFKSVVASFKQAMAEMLAQAATNGLMRALFGVGKGSGDDGLQGALKGGGAAFGPVGGILGGLLGGLFGGHRAMGGPVLPGRSYVVGDGGRPELFTPNTAGYIHPSVGGGGGIGALNIHIHGATFANGYDVQRVSNDIAYHLKQRQRVERTVG